MKKGISGDLILQIGIVLIASLTTIASVNVFYDAVETSVLGDPTIAAKTLAITTDFVDSSSVPISIYHEIPTDFLGNPGYGTVLFNPVECEYTLSKYPQDYMSNLILNAAWDNIPIEEGLLYYSLYKYNKDRTSTAKLARIASDAGQDLTTRELQKWREDQYREKILRKQFEQAGYNLDEVNKAILEKKLEDDLKSAKLYGEYVNEQYIQQVTDIELTKQEEINSATRQWSDEAKALAELSDEELIGKIDINTGEITGKYHDRFDFYFDERINPSKNPPGGYKNKMSKTGNTQITRTPSEEFLSNERTKIRNDIIQERDFQISNANNKAVSAISELDEAKSLGDDAVKKALADANDNYNKAFDKINPDISPNFFDESNKLYASLDDATIDAIERSGRNDLKSKIPGVKKYRAYKLSKALEKAPLLAETQIAKKGFLKRAGSSSLNVIKSPFIKGASFVKTAAIESAERAKKRIKFMGKVTGLNKLYNSAAKQTSERIGKSAVRSLAVKATTEVAEPACSGLAIFAPVCILSVKGMSWISYALEYGLTYLPIVYFINKSQKATEAVENSFSTISCKSENNTYYVSKPNCESESVLNYPDFDNSFIGEIKIFGDIAEGIFAMPSSSPILKSKEYPNIINSDNNCVDSHNNLLSKDATPKVLQDNIINPREMVATIPFVACGAVTAIKASFGPGCTFGWGILYLGSWADPQISGSFSAYFSGGVLAAFAGPAAIGLTTAFLTNPVDSKSFFPYISKSAGMIDSDNNYYIENPLVIEISKKEHNGILITEINKLL